MLSSWKWLNEAEEKEHMLKEVLGLMGVFISFNLHHAILSPF